MPSIKAPSTGTDTLASGVEATGVAMLATTNEEYNINDHG